MTLQITSINFDKEVEEYLLIISLSSPWLVHPHHLPRIVKQTILVSVTNANIKSSSWPCTLYNYESA